MHKIVIKQVIIYFKREFISPVFEFGEIFDPADDEWKV